MLEFQDPPDFNYGVLEHNNGTAPSVTSSSNNNNTKFNGLVLDTLNSLVALPNLTDKMVGAAAHSGSAAGDEEGMI